MISPATAAKIIPGWFRPWMILVAISIALLGMLGAQTLNLLEAEKSLANEQAAHETTKRLDAEALTRSIADARDREHEMQASLEQIQATARKEKEIAKAREDALVESVRSGERRLSIAAVCPSPAAPGLRAPAAGGSGPSQARAELAPAAGLALIGIARDGDEAIRERNACVAAYEAVRAKLNGDAAP